METDTSLINKAKNMVKIYHKDQKRKSGELYITHLFNVYEILKSYGLPNELLVSGILHDTIEDTPLTKEEIQKEFGERVSFIVAAVSKAQKPIQPKIYKNPLQKCNSINKEFYEKLSKIESQNFRFLTYVNKFYYSTIADPWVAFVKIADQIDNLRDIEVFPVEKAKRKLEEIHFYFWPIYEKITQNKIMTHEIVDSYNAIKKQLWVTVEKKKKELNINLKTLPLSV